MFLLEVDRRVTMSIRLGGLALIVWSVLRASHHPAAHGRGLLVAVLLAMCTLAWLGRMTRDRGVTLELYVLAGAGGALTGACPNSAAGAFVFIAVAGAALRAELRQVIPVGLLGAFALALTTLVYHNSGVGLVAYILGLVATALAAANARQSVGRAEQAELLLAQAQRSQEEQLRVARLEESARIARDIHDVLAHALAGLTIQLEATISLLEQGADRELVAGRVRRAHALAREGLQETRRAVGALRGDAVSVPAAIEALLDEYRSRGEGQATMTIEGDPRRLQGPAAETMIRVAQEALTNVSKHAPGAGVSIRIDAGEEIVLTVVNTVNGAAAAPLAATGGGYGLRGMRERAQLLGGTLNAGPDHDGWRVELRLPPRDT